MSEVGGDFFGEVFIFPFAILKRSKKLICLPPPTRRFAENEADGAGHLPPAAGCSGEFLAALRGKPVELCLAIVFAYAPLGGEQAAVFKAMEGGIERALLNFERILRGVLDHLRDRMAMRRAP
jgi:hypothetical protein